LYGGNGTMLTPLSERPPFMACKRRLYWFYLFRVCGLKKQSRNSFYLKGRLVQNLKTNLTIKLQMNSKLIDVNNIIRS
ncbi:hypothetical protein NSX54_23905, partial [Salmonella enterica]|nr:hypothetical protein [Salmonella enterica]